MAKHVWFDRLWALTHPEHTDVDEHLEGLVLSGGGSRASFQIGALRYLYETRHIAPQSIVAASAGSIVGSMLAQTLDPLQQLENLRTLEDYWLAMSDPSEMYAEQAWFSKLREQWTDIADVIPEPTNVDPAFVETKDVDAEHLVKEALDFDPSTQGNDFSFSVAWQLLSSLGRLGKVGAGLASALRGAERAASAYRPGPIVYRLLFESGFTARAVRESGMRLRLAFVGLRSGDLRFMREDGIIVDTDDQPVSDTAFDLSLGVWASCAIPGVFRPVKLGDEVYADGGVRENVPVEMAVEMLGMTKPYVIVSTPPGVSPHFTATDIVSVMMRSFAILLDESIRDEVAWARRAGAIVIAPQIDVHGSMDVDHALLRINRDYGWMRAAEEMTGTPSGTTDPIIQARLDLYRLLSSPDAGEDHPDHDRRVASARETLRVLLDHVDPVLMPEGYREWAQEDLRRHGELASVTDHVGAVD
ncbi:MAG: patatin-like phospholipase family protein [Propionibacteriaceae bacterium]|nr:patatin-like phospholipase family protein [Propionibacteriaceae bacterium]